MRVKLQRQNAYQDGSVCITVGSIVLSIKALKNYVYIHVLLLMHTESSSDGSVCNYNNTVQNTIFQRLYLRIAQCASPHQIGCNRKRS